LRVCWRAERASTDVVKRQIGNQSARAQLAMALREQSFVKVRRAFAGGERIDGFIAAVGAKFCAVARVSEGREPAGHDFVRISDIRKVERDPDPDAIEVRILRARGRWPLDPVDVPLDDIAALLSALQSGNRLIALHMEETAADAMWVGVVSAVRGGEVELFSLTPQGVWEDDVDDFALRDVTRVTVGDAYLEGLEMVAGEPPKQT
jgi:hypothetical protein